MKVYTLRTLRSWTQKNIYVKRIADKDNPYAIFKETGNGDTSFIMKGKNLKTLTGIVDTMRRQHIEEYVRARKVIHRRAY